MYIYIYAGYIAVYYILLDAINIIKFQMVLNQFSITFAFYRNKFRDLLDACVCVCVPEKCSSPAITSNDHCA